MNSLHLDLLIDIIFQMNPIRFLWKWNTVDVYFQFYKKKSFHEQDDGFSRLQITYNENITNMSNIMSPKRKPTQSLFWITMYLFCFPWIILREYVVSCLYAQLPNWQYKQGIITALFHSTIFNNTLVWVKTSRDKCAYNSFKGDNSLYNSITSDFRIPCYKMKKHSMQKGLKLYKNFNSGKNIW